MTADEIKQDEAERKHYDWAMEQARKRMKPEEDYERETDGNQKCQN